MAKKHGFAWRANQILLPELQSLRTPSTTDLSLDCVFVKNTHIFLALKIKCPPLALGLPFPTPHQNTAMAKTTAFCSVEVFQE